MATHMHYRLDRVTHPAVITLPDPPRPTHGGKTGNWYISQMCTALIRDDGGVWILLSCAETYESEEEKRGDK